MEEFWKLMKGLNYIDLSSLVNLPRLLGKVYLYNHQKRSVRHPEQGQLPWTVVHMLAAKSRKHVYFGGKLPPKDKYMEAIAVMASRLKYILTRTVDRKARPWWKDKPNRNDRWSTDGIVDPQIIAVCHDVKQQVRKEILTAIGRASKSAPWWRTMPVAHRHARQWLARYGLLAIPTDKDGGFCIACHEHIEELAEIKFTSQLYEEVNPNAIDEYKIVQQYCSLIDRAQKTLNNVDRKMHGYFIRSVRGEKQDAIASKASLTMKSHKPDGQVDIRIIHSGIGNPFSAFSGMTGAYLRKRAIAMKHFLCGSTDDAISIIKRSRVSARATLAKIDIKDFYLQGDHVQISDTAFNDNPPGDQRVLANVLLHILSHQYAYVNVLPGRLFRVRTGTGIGQRASGELADAFYYEMVEVWCANETVLRDHGIELYFRYRDDILVAFNDATLWQEFLKGIQTRASVAWKVNLEDVNDQK
jgi:hypothetical protein